MLLTLFSVFFSISTVNMNHTHMSGKNLEMADQISGLILPFLFFRRVRLQWINRGEGREKERKRVLSQVSTTK